MVVIESEIGLEYNLEKKKQFQRNTTIYNLGKQSRIYCIICFSLD